MFTTCSWVHVHGQAAAREVGGGLELLLYIYIYICAYTSCGLYNIMSDSAVAAACTVSILITDDSACRKQNTNAGHIIMSIY